MPNEVTYLTVINGLCKSGRALEALELLRLLENGRCKPDVKAYNTVIDGLCKDRMVDDAFQIFSTMVNKGVLPNVATYNAMIQEHGSVGIPAKYLSRRAYLALV